MYVLVIILIHVLYYRQISDIQKSAQQITIWSKPDKNILAEGGQSGLLEDIKWRL